MEDPRFALSIEARDDLVSIAAFIAERDGVRIASSVTARIMRAVGLLAYMPGMGRPRPDLQGAPRSFQVRSWTIFYRPNEDLGGITVLRVPDSRRDIDRILGHEED